VCIFGIGFSNFTEDKALKFNIKPIYPEYINILMLHGTVDINFKNNAYNETTSEHLNSLEMDYIALGHFHNRIDNIGGFGTIYNPGSPEPLGFDETGEHGVILGTLTKGEDGVAPLLFKYLNINKRFYENIDVNISGLNTQEQISLRISEELEKENGLNERLIKNGLFCVTLKGYVETGFKVDTSQLQVSLAEKVFYLKVKDETTADYNFAEIVKEPGLRGLFTRKILTKIDNAEAEYEKKLLLKALYYGLEALDTGRVDL
jgi:DNA repair exonuclease SbcCD nuclease subunit